MIFDPIPPEIRDDPRRLAAVKRGNRILEELPQITTAQVHVSWSLATGPGGPPILIVTLKELRAGSFSFHFTPENLDDDRLWWHIYKQWQRFLSQRYDRIMEHLDTLIGSEVAS